MSNKKSNIEFVGLREVLLNLGASEKDIANYSRAATHKIASTAVKRAKRLAPKDTGRLRKAIKAKRRKARVDLFRSDIWAYLGESRGDKKGAYYWAPVESGSKQRTTKKGAHRGSMSGHGYIERALKQTGPDAIKIFRSEVVGRAIKSMNKRAK